jgi:hypothetical protein
LISASDLSAAPGATPDPPATSGILYVVKGAARLSGASSQDLKTGEGAFVDSQSRPKLSNPGAAGAEWYYIATQAAADRASPPTLAGSQRLFASGDLPPLPRINQAEALQQVTLQPGGRTEGYRPNGVELFIGLQGTVEVRASTLGAPMSLSSGQAALVLEGTAVQVLNRGSRPAAYLTFFLLPDGTALTRPDH